MFDLIQSVTIISTNPTLILLRNIQQNKYERGGPHKPYNYMVMHKSTTIIIVSVLKSSFCKGQFPICEEWNLDVDSWGITLYTYLSVLPVYCNVMCTFVCTSTLHLSLYRQSTNKHNISMPFLTARPTLVFSSRSLIILWWFSSLSVDDTDWLNVLISPDCMYCQPRYDLITCCCGLSYMDDSQRK
jgi:hypothetical protein